MDQSTWTCCLLFTLQRNAPTVANWCKRDCTSSRLRLVIRGPVTKQTEAHSCALMYDPIISVEGNRFSMTGFQPQAGVGGAESTPASHQVISQNHAQKFLISLSVLKMATQTVLHPLWKVHLWVSESPSCSSFFLQDLGYIILSFHIVVQESMCYVTLDHGGVQGGTRPKRVVSPYVLQRSRSQHFLVTAQHSTHLSQIHAWFSMLLHSSISFSRSPHSSISSLLLSFPQAEWLPSLLPQAAWLNLLIS